MSGNVGQSKKKRGPYLRYLADPEVNIPKVSKWRKRGLQNDVDDLTTGTDLCDCSAEVSEEETFTIANVDEPIELDADGACNDVEGNVDDPALSDEEYMYETFADDELEDLDINNEESDELDDEIDETEPTETPEISDEDKPLYPGARLTLAASMLLIITFVVRHGLSGVALNDLLVLVELHCISPNLFRKSVKLFNSYFKQLRAPIEFHYYHKKCKSYLGRTTPNVCPSCHGSLKDDISYFVVVPILYQLQNLFQDIKFIDSIRSYRLSRKKNCADNIEDVMDGDLYKKHFDTDYFFRGSKEEQKDKEIHISLQVNTDGVALFRSSSFGVWPLYFIVNELHPLLRFKRKYRIFAGLWFGYEKPVFKIFMKPFAETLRDLFHSGATIMVEECKLTARVLLLNGVFDSPARCLFQNFVQFNGFYGCPFCLNPGKTVKTSERGTTHTYPFETTNMATGCGRERTHEETIQHASMADDLLLDGKETPVCGIKGSTWFMFVPGFDIIKGVALDYMHCILLGVMKMLLTLWVDKSYRNEAFYVGNQIKTVDSRLTAIHPPHCITRTPRSLSELSHFKATELKAFLLFYGATCMWQILPDEYFQHFLLLVEGTYLLLQDSISNTDLDKAAKLLKHFCINITALYGERFETSNIHMLLHLTQKVKDLGPLWCNSCFYFEDFNGELRNLFHGTQKVDMQITLAVCIQQKIPEMEKSLGYGSSARVFYEQLTERKSSNHIRGFISEGIHSVGRLQNFKATSSDKAAIENVLGGRIDNSLKFTRLELRGDVIHSIDYKRVWRRNSHTVQFCVVGGVGYGHVKYYAKVYQECPNPVFCDQSCECKVPYYLAIVQPLECSDVQLANDDITGATIPHIIPVKRETASVIALQVSNIVQLCVFISNHGAVDAVCLFPNRFEKD